MLDFIGDPQWGITTTEYSGILAVHAWLVPHQFSRRDKRVRISIAPGEPGRWALPHPLAYTIDRDCDVLERSTKLSTPAPGLARALAGAQKIVLNVFTAATQFSASTIVETRSLELQVVSAGNSGNQLSN